MGGYFARGFCAELSRLHGPYVVGPDAMDPDRYWIQRLQATGQAQARYLWVLFLSGLFYAALWYQPAPMAAEQSHGLAVPVIDLRLSAPVVLASGPSVIALLVLIVMGALRAFSVAQWHLGKEIQSAGGSERFDVHPNALDLAVYTTAESPRWAASILYFTYPLVLIAALAEAAWLWWRIQNQPSPPPGWLLFGVVGVLLWAPAVYVVVVGMLFQRIKKARSGGHLKPPISAKDAGGSDESCLTNKGTA